MSSTGSSKPPNTFVVLDSGNSNFTQNDTSTRPKSSGSSRPGSGTIEGRRALPLNRVESVDRRTPTPTKQILVQTVRRKQENHDTNDNKFMVNPRNKLDKTNDERSSKGEHSRKQVTAISAVFVSGSCCASQGQPVVSSRDCIDDSLASLSTSTSSSLSLVSSGYRSETTGSASSGMSIVSSTDTLSASTMEGTVEDNEQHDGLLTSRSAWGEGGSYGDEEERGKSGHLLDKNFVINNKSSSSNCAVKPEVVDLEDSDAFDTDLSDGESSSSDTSVEEAKAPTQLLMEFLNAVMEKDYETAEKLCKMILMYEPKNEEALSFQTLIAERKELGDVEDSSSSEDDSDNESSDDDSSDDDSSSSSDDDDSSKPDSGVVSASEQGD